MNSREAFEQKFSQLPYQWNMERLPDYGSAWPNQYKEYKTQCSWEVWQDACQWKDEQYTHKIDWLESQCKELARVALRNGEEIPRLEYRLQQAQSLHYEEASKRRELESELRSYKASFENMEKQIKELEADRNNWKNHADSESVHSSMQYDQIRELEGKVSAREKLVESLNARIARLEKLNVLRKRYEDTNKLLMDKLQELEELRIPAWRSIETAPTDGTVFVGTDGKYAYRTRRKAYYEKFPHQKGGPTYSYKWDKEDDHSVCPWMPTLWVPLPAGDKL